MALKASSSTTPRSTAIVSAESSGIALSAVSADYGLDKFEGCVGVVISTMLREDSFHGTVSYLHHTIKGIDDTFKSTSYCRHIAVFNVRPEHPLPDKEIIQHEFSNVTFIDINIPNVDPDWDFWYEWGYNVLGARKMQQFLDVRAMMQLYSTIAHEELTLWMEDDFVFCPHSASHLEKSLQFMSQHVQHPHVGGVRFSTGAGALLLRTRDFSTYAYEIEKRPVDDPIDWLLSRLWKDLELTMFTYRGALLLHKGEVSTVGNTEQVSCWAGRVWGCIF